MKKTNCLQYGLFVVSIAACSVPNAEFQEESQLDFSLCEVH